MDIEKLLRDVDPAGSIFDERVAFVVAVALRDPAVRANRFSNRLGA